MTVVSSFTLCPSDPSMAQAVTMEGGQAVAHHNSQFKKRKEMSSSSNTDRPVLLDGPVSHMMSGYGMPPTRGNAYQATPFHPLVHHRKMISPLKVEELNVHVQQRLENRAPLQPQHHHTLAVDPGYNGWTRLAADPPVAEIQIPAGAPPYEGATDREEFEEEGDVDDDSWINGHSGRDHEYDEHSFERLESWKSMYFVAQRDLHVARAESQAVLEENRRLKRHLFELQRRLFESQRKRQRLANDVWKVPDPPGPPKTQRSNKQQQKSTTQEDTTQATDPHHRVPRAISSEESATSGWEGTTKTPQAQQQQPLLPV
ncbi:hypothetical protein ACA910_004990 [Epithemia clementina (nom. ined.)]